MEKVVTKRSKGVRAELFVKNLLITDDNDNVQSASYFSYCLGPYLVPCLHFCFVFCLAFFQLPQYLSPLSRILFCFQLHILPYTPLPLLLVIWFFFCLIFCPLSLVIPFVLLTTWSTELAPTPVLNCATRFPNVCTRGNLFSSL